MEWSGRAPAPPAIEAGKGRQRQWARHVAHGSSAALSRCPSYVRIPPDRDHIAGVLALRFRANRRHRVAANLFSHPIGPD